MKYHIDQKWDESVRRGICFFSIFQEAKNDFTAIQYADDLVTGSAVAINLEQF